MSFKIISCMFIHNMKIWMKLELKVLEVFIKQELVFIIQEEPLEIVL